MKFIALALAATVGTGVAFFKPTLPFSKPKPTETTTTSVLSSTIPGNLIDTRLNNEKQDIVSLPKTVLKTKVDPSRVLYLNAVVEYGVMQQLVDQLKTLQAESTEPVYLLIDSPGGSVLDGATLISEMEASRAPVYTVCTRICASMAAMIHSYGAKRFVTDRAILMYHPASGGAQGQVPNMLSQLTTLTRYLDKMVANVVTRSKVTKAEYNALVGYEIWIDSEDSVVKGLADGIINLNVPNHDPSNSGSLQNPDQQRRKSAPSVVTPQPFNFDYISPYLGLWDRNHARKN